MHDLAMALVAPRQPLVALHRPVPDPGPGEVLLEVGACGVCRTDLHIADGDLPLPRTPLVPGHEIVGRVVAAGPGARRFRPGDRVGVPWLGGTCGHCRQCAGGR
ncbi:MAG: alcohol dehydrogenase catalytic domain-containing protein, partial [Burkholderiales bacterium]|nr:alcohol dehydrogenase catalytic domain-containing protein [Burkholderiales bacterium]